MFSRPAIIYSRSFLGLDLRVWITLFFTVFLSLVLFGFKVFNSTTCSAIKLSANGNFQHRQSNSFYVSETISFTAVSEGAKRIAWDFGDGTPIVTGSTRKHTYEAEGEFQVTAIVNGKCKEAIRVVIRDIENSGSSFSTESASRSPIMGNTFATAGIIELYSCHLPASEYKWSIENGPQYDEKLGQSVSFSFADTGTYILVVQLDNDESKIYKQVITVRPVSNGSTADMLPKPDVTPIPLPTRPDPAPKDESANTRDEVVTPLPTPSPDPPPAKKRYLQLNKLALEEMLREVVEKKRNVPDFDNILCDGGNTMVTVNNKTKMTFAELCKRLQDRKGIFKSKVKNINVSSAPYETEQVSANARGCLVTMSVEFKQ